MALQNPQTGQEAESHQAKKAEQVLKLRPYSASPLRQAVLVAHSRGLRRLKSLGLADGIWGGLRGGRLRPLSLLRCWLWRRKRPTTSPSAGAERRSLPSRRACPPRCARSDCARRAAHSVTRATKSTKDFGILGLRDCIFEVLSRALEISTNQLRIQLYDGKYLHGSAINSKRTPYDPRTGLCLEPGEVHTDRALYKFGAD